MKKTKVEVFQYGLSLVEQLDAFDRIKKELIETNMLRFGEDVVFVFNLPKSDETVVRVLDKKLLEKEVKKDRITYNNPDINTGSYLISSMVAEFPKDFPNKEMDVNPELFQYTEIGLK